MVKIPDDCIEIDNSLESELFIPSNVVRAYCLTDKSLWFYSETYKNWAKYGIQDLRDTPEFKEWLKHKLRHRKIKLYNEERNQRRSK
jgi:hypothetical protein